MVNGIKFVNSSEELAQWVTTAKVGHRVCYYRGWLMKDKLQKMPFMVKGNVSIPEFRTPNKAWDFYQMGVVELFQKRMGDEDYLYLAVRK